MPVYDLAPATGDRSVKKAVDGALATEITAQAKAAGRAAPVVSTTPAVDTTPEAGA